MPIPTEVFSCPTGIGTSPSVSPGTYDIQFELTGTSGLVATAPEQAGVIVTAGRDTPLQPIAFAVNAVGGLALTIDALQPGGNCAAAGPPTNGAGISKMSITLTHAAGGGCEPAMLMIGAMPYLIDCATPLEFDCVESTVSITAAAMPSDAYQIHVRGKQGTETCFSNDDSIRVPPNGKTLQRGLILAATGAAGCL